VERLDNVRSLCRRWDHHALPFFQREETIEDRPNRGRLLRCNASRTNLQDEVPAQGIARTARVSGKIYAREEQILFVRKKNETPAPVVSRLRFRGGGVREPFCVRVPNWESKIILCAK
jgi:hypothetical protein